MNFTMVIHTVMNYTKGDIFDKFGQMFWRCCPKNVQICRVECFNGVSQSFQILFILYSNFIPHDSDVSTQALLSFGARE